MSIRGVHHEAVPINADWDEQEHARWRELLIHKLAKRGDMDVDLVRQRVMFDEHIGFGTQKLLVASLDRFEPAYKPITCRHCRRQLALAIPTRLLFNEGSYCESRVTLRCSSCRAQRMWEPCKTLDELEHSCYAEPGLVTA